jgi:hypothetical protein
LRCFKEDVATSNIKIVAEQASEQAVAVALSLTSDFLQRFSLQHESWHLIPAILAGISAVVKPKDSSRRFGRGTSST